MIYTNSNRYGIDQESVSAFTSKINDTFIRVETNNNTYLTNGYIYLLPAELIAMQENTIVPFPEHVTSLLKSTRIPEDIETITKNLQETLSRPKLLDPVFS
ncbi:MAG: hypothetical protein ACKOW9_01325 [Candidatus Paceibacterota bacterium]